MRQRGEIIVDNIRGENNKTKIGFFAASEFLGRLTKATKDENSQKLMDNVVGKFLDEKKIISFKK